MNLEDSEETLNKLKTEFPNIPKVLIKRFLCCPDVAVNPKNLESIQKELRGFQDIETPKGRGRGKRVTKRPSTGQQEVGDLAGCHLNDQKRTCDAIQKKCMSIFAADEFGAQHPGPPGNLNRFDHPPPTKPKPWPRRKHQDLSTKDQGEYKECPSERGACKDNHQGGDISEFLQEKQEDNCQTELNQGQGQLIHDDKKGLRGASKKIKKGSMHFKSNVKSDCGQREEISRDPFALGSEIERGRDHGDEHREQSMSRVGENQSLGIEKDERFEENRLVVGERSGPTTNEGVLNHADSSSPILLLLLLPLFLLLHIWDCFTYGPAFFGDVDKSGMSGEEKKDWFIHWPQCMNQSQVTTLRLKNATRGIVNCTAHRTLAAHHVPCTCSTLNPMGIIQTLVIDVD